MGFKRRSTKTAPAAPRMSDFRVAFGAAKGALEVRLLNGEAHASAISHATRDGLRVLRTYLNGKRPAALRALKSKIHGALEIRLDRYVSRTGSRMKGSPVIEARRRTLARDLVRRAFLGGHYRTYPPPEIEVRFGPPSCFGERRRDQDGGKYVITVRETWLENVARKNLACVEGRLVLDVANSLTGGDLPDYVSALWSARWAEPALGYGLSEESGVIAMTETGPFRVKAPSAEAAWRRVSREARKRAYLAHKRKVGS